MKENNKALQKIDKKRQTKKQYSMLIAIVAIIVLADQISKIIITNCNEINVIPGWMLFHTTQNRNPAYGIGSNSTIMYVSTNIIILGVIYKFITTQNEFVDTKLKVFLSFILAGGLSNVIDRIIRGYVVEFIDLKQIINLPIFNIADLFIIIGWVSVAAIFAYFTVKEWRENKK